MNFFSRIIKRNNYIKKNDLVLVHIGCGEQNDERFLNIDINPLSHIHWVKDVSNLDYLKNDFADMIYASHVLEHFTHKKTLEILSNWYEKLKSGGILRLSVPDLDKLIDIYKKENNNLDWIIDSLMGGQDSKYNFHKTVFNKNSLSSLLLQAGFKEVREWEPGGDEFYSFDDWASKKIHDKYKVSLNLEAIK